jgi:hypothetical protein
MIKARVIFTDSATTVRWDTTVTYTSPEKEKHESLPPEGSEQYRNLIQQAVENIWGNLFAWKNSGRFNSGQVIKKNNFNIEKVTNLLQVDIEKSNS